MRRLLGADWLRSELVSTGPAEKASGQRTAPDPAGCDARKPFGRDPFPDVVRRWVVSSRPLIAVIVAAVVTVGAAAFALGRGVASDSGTSSSNTTAAAANAPQGPTTPVAIKDFAFSPE